MELILAGVVLLGVIAWWVIRWLAKPGDQQVEKRAAPRVSTPEPAPVSAPPTTAVAIELPAIDIPSPLAGFFRLDASALTDERRQSLIQRLESLPRPPRALQQLTSPSYLQKASSAEIAELVMSEPALAAKVLATVNSPLYGLRQPVGHLGQGITFLGLNSVRSICMQHMLNASFAVASPTLRPAFEHYWKASAIGSELCAKLASKLGMPEGGVMVTQVVLSFLGPMAALTLMPEDRSASMPTMNLLERTQAEQEMLGVSGAGLGELLMTHWGLPGPIVQQVARMDACLEQPYLAVRPEATATALSYWCARVGEQLARVTPAQWEAFEWDSDDSLDTALVRPYLKATLAERLTTNLQDPVIAQSLTALITGQPQASA